MSLGAVVILVMPLVAAAVGKGADQSGITQIGKFHHPTRRQRLTSKAAGWKSRVL
ncbi:hypothetical protein PEC302110_27180 [Pectobacterium araliae]|uniref:Uncharacterized protein n=1 Tax=Pectobacterium araliae TaxID=3073862 RepID=A0AAN0MLV9_9GAMM|nr:hypothetical protein PEC302110_27180 [Pectobacterium sp. MAFF 302110]